MDMMMMMMTGLGKQCRPGQTNPKGAVSDQSLYCLLFHLHNLEVAHQGRMSWFEFRVFTIKLVGVQKFSHFMVQTL